MTTTPSAGASREFEEQGRSARKRRAIIDAATEVFLQKGYLATNMDEIAALAAVSKQTVYKNFPGKEALFVEIVRSVSTRAGDKVHNEMPDIAAGEDISEYLERYAYRQLTVVLTPRVMQLRRLVIGEVGRFPELAKTLFDDGPRRAMAVLASLFKRLADRGLLAIDDPAVAACQFNWLVMAEPLNRAMLLGDEAIPKPAELRRHAAAGVRTFLAAYGKTRGRKR
ncbi:MULTISPECIES: TetR/AcrR family transcriptional regulator [unclassified Bradyrhizobium]|uniref:TetR/AcrR family transcriptional regulator n=1 Tax=unclassified Bradyrhizobium TaxID=2631580 RepID=UPI002478C76E|nr:MULTISPECIES: TetR/AcrR family transcriptional regulator [unclassified Bradyrhizobium]WGR68389.1 TetR/AcrR family transcriptional regulator [Bradyrhizobium sp. ISRA426]WGR80444.1 TetR/AcrR family transcriptional regulator [Bradyrhizobium sp. ISRA430]WGR83629.1 TetR/AcrR family transcriptional regulator [Bradyrhizobium sp. ISRA432]